VSDTANSPLAPEALRLSHKVVPMRSTRNEQAVPPNGETAGAAGSAADNVISRVGQLTRTLHESLRELGYDKRLGQAASEITDAQDRLSYVAMLTQQAAERALNAIEIAKPNQDELASRATHLAGRWRQVWDDHGKAQAGSQFADLVTQTRDYLGDVPTRTNATNAQLMEIMMAQEFQDLTGQVIKKITTMVQTLEHELVQLLMDNVPSERKPEADTGLINGPVVNAQARSDIVTSQNQVDDVLASLGF